MAVRSNRPSRSKSSSRLIRCDGLRTVIDTVPRGTAGGMTNWMRSPLGSVAASSGRSWLMCWSEKVATAVANDRQRSCVNSGAAKVSQPCTVSTSSSPGRLTHTSSTPGASSRSRSGRRNSMTEVASPHQASVRAAAASRLVEGFIGRGLGWVSVGSACSSYTDEKSTSRAT